MRKFHFKLQGVKIIHAKYDRYLIEKNSITNGEY